MGREARVKRTEPKTERVERFNYPAGRDWR
jgi:hypothetical protein